jgi:DNA-directed RNA polymerase specialized sigma subunit
MNGDKHSLFQSLQSSLHRICRWRVPPNWSISEWRREMHAEAACAACHAAKDYDPSLGVPLEAYARQRVLSTTFTRYRREWAYASRIVKEFDPERSDSKVSEPSACTVFDEWPRCTLAQLSECDLWLVRQLFLTDRSEADVARQIGVSQQAINKRKKIIIQRMKSRISKA